MVAAPWTAPDYTVHPVSATTVERYVGQLRRKTGTRRQFRQVAPAPLCAEDHDESHPAPLTALRAACLFLATLHRLLNSFRLR